MTEPTKTPVQQDLTEDMVVTTLRVLSGVIRAQGEKLDAIFLRLETPSLVAPAPEPVPEVTPPPKKLWKRLPAHRDTLDKLLRRAVHSSYGVLIEVPANLEYDAQGVRSRAHTLLGPGAVRVIDGSGEIAGYVTPRRR